MTIGTEIGLSDVHAFIPFIAEAAEPYINHLAEVAKLLADATDGGDPVLVAAGILHDTIEDTDAGYEDLAEEFGRQIADLVGEVT
ncbi:MAG: HD domain-containing protein, partial [Rhodospirillales bacterium]|nr:HD domain-containing protein [Rhodospirillales bacterium]